MSKKSIIKLTSTILYLVISIACIVLIIFRKNIFGPTTIFYNLYEEEMAANFGVKIIKTVVILIGGVLVINVSKYLKRLDKVFKQRNIQTLIILLGNVVKYVTAVVIVILILSAWGVDTTALITGAGVLSLIIGLGCQTMVADIVAGIFIIFEGDFQVGDVVVIDGWRGTVQTIGLRTTKIIDAAGNVKIVNNSSITDIVNNTKDLSISICDVGIEYNESLERVENILNNNLDDIKKAIPAIVNGPFYKGVTQLGESCVVIRIIAQCKEEDKYQTDRDLNRQIKLLFDQNNINIPFNQVVINYRDPEEDVHNVNTRDRNEANRFVREQRELSKGIEEEK